VLSLRLREALFPSTSKHFIPYKYPSPTLQPYLQSGDGPIVLVLAPTRELALQIKQECDKFGASSEIKNTVVYGGVPKHTQVRDLRYIYIIYIYIFVFIYIYIYDPSRIIFFSGYFFISLFFLQSRPKYLHLFYNHDYESKLSIISTLFIRKVIVFGEMYVIMLNTYHTEANVHICIP
jgi:hypothetical protein